MRISKEAKKTEALKRMEILDLTTEAIKEFETSDRIRILAANIKDSHWADNETMRQIRKIEAKNDIVIYLGMRSYTNMGTYDCFFYVGNDTSKWATDREKLKRNETAAYCHNYNRPKLSAFGEIGFA